MTATIIRFPVERTQAAQEAKAECMAQYNDWKGSKYDRGLSRKEIAAKFREDVKAAKKAGTLPKGLKLSVRITRGRGIDVDIRETGGIRFLSREYIEWSRANPHSLCRHIDSYTTEGKTLLETLRSMLGAYNYDRSDIMTDYFDVNFYASVSYHWEFERDERKAIEAEIAAANA